MKRMIVILAVMAVAFTGCQTGPRESTQDEIERLLNYGESGLLVALTVAGLWVARTTNELSRRAPELWKRSMPRINWRRFK